MGRPIKSKFFGNTNTGATRRSDNHIGGEGVDGINLTNAGTYTSGLPTVTFAAPEIPTGVRATGDVHANALSAVATAAGTGYNLGDVLSENIVAGNDGRYATWTVTGLTVRGITLKNGGTANDVGDVFAFNNPNWPTAMRVRVTASNSGVATAVELVDGGVLTTGALPAATDAGGFTRVQTAAGQDYNGQNLQVNITAWGVATVAVADQGNYTAITGGAKATTAAPAGGSGATLTITYGLSGIEITEPGSGYRSAPAITVSTGGGSFTADLTGSQQNALDFVAWITGGSSAKIGDIINQVTTTAYRVRTADGIGKAKLVADTPAEGEMNLIATDSWGSTYYVIRIQEHLVRVVQKDDADGFQFQSGSQVVWTFDAPVEGYSVSVANK
jgi:hypothetical protein